MMKKAVKLAALIAVGVAIGGCVLPRIFFRSLYNDTCPPIWKQAGQWFILSFLSAFLLLTLFYEIKEWLSKSKRKSKRFSSPAIGGEAAVRHKAVRALFESTLPADVDWNQVNDFLRTTKFYKQLLLDKWRESAAFTEYPVSDTTIACLGCIHEDLAGCYQGTFAFDENGKEDRHEEYRLLNENLHLKYEGIDADLLNLIYLHYLQEDR